MADEEEDIISTLPDPILCHILSFLETKQSVATSVLSKKWNPLWRSVTSLRFNTNVRNQISNVDFIDSVYSVLLSRDAALPINTFHLHVIYHYYPLQCSIKSITKWVNFVFQRGLQYLSLSTSKTFKLPITILTCKTLVVLKLNSCSVEHCLSSVVLPSLKTLHLKFTWLPGLRDFELFLTGCPILEDLFTRHVSISDETFEDVPLTCNKWKGSYLTNLARADIDCFYHYFPLKAVYNVQSLRFQIFKGFYHDDLIPTFHNLIHLELNCDDFNKEFLLDVLNHCPKLQSFDLVIDVGEEVRASQDDKLLWVFPDVVPQCLSLHLRTCNLSGFLGLHCDLMLVRYILKNAKVLQSMKIWKSGEPEVKRILSSFPRASSMCKLMVYHGDVSGSYTIIPVV